MEATKQQISLDDAINIFSAREYAFDMLRRFFIEEPSEQYLKLFVYQNMVDLFPFQDESSDIREGIQDIKDYLKACDPVNTKEDYENLHWDYTRMFIGPFEIPVFPWESTYVRKDKMLFQETTMEVRKIYKKFAFESVDHIEADDHIGLELDFMFHLNQLCIQSSDPANPNALAEVSYLLNEQQNFMKDHLMKFANKFADGVIEKADTKFYIGAAKLLKGYLQLDSTVLNELLNIDLVKNNNLGGAR